MLHRHKELSDQTGIQADKGSSIINPRFLSSLNTNIPLVAGGREEDLEVGFDGPDLEAAHTPSDYIPLARNFHIGPSEKEAQKFRIVLCPETEGNGFEELLYSPKHTNNWKQL